MDEKQEPITGTPPPAEPLPETSPAHGIDDKEPYAGRPDQDIKHTIGPGAGGATEWGGGNKRNPVRQNKNVRQGAGYHIRHSRH